MTDQQCYGLTPEETRVVRQMMTINSDIDRKMVAILDRVLRACAEAGFDPTPLAEETPPSSP